MKRLTTRELTYMALFIVLLTVCSWIAIPAVVPFTLQTFAVFLTVALLGGRRGFFTILVYLLLGALGVPVFAGFSGGLGVLIGPLGGYLAGFLLTALVMWGVVALGGDRLPVQAIAMTLGLLVCYAAGTAWFLAVYVRAGEPRTLAAALGACVLPFILPDLAKIALALLLSRRLKKLVRL